VVLVVLIIAVAFWRPATSQDNYEERIGSLETRVRIVERSTRATAVPANTQAPTATPKTTSTPDVGRGQTIRVSGGQAVSEPFLLSEGNHLFEADCTGVASSVYLRIDTAPGSSADLNYATLAIGEEMPFTGESLVAVYESGAIVVVLDTIGGDVVCNITVDTK